MNSLSWPLKDPQTRLAFRDGRPYQNGWIFGKVPKLYIADFGPLNRAFSAWKWYKRVSLGYVFNQFNGNTMLNCCTTCISWEIGSYNTQQSRHNEHTHFCREIRNMIFRRWGGGGVKGRLELFRKFIRFGRADRPKVWPGCGQWTYMCKNKKVTGSRTCNTQKIIPKFGEVNLGLKRRAWHNILWVSCGSLHVVRTVWQWQLLQMSQVAQTRTTQLSSV